MTKKLISIFVLFVSASAFANESAIYYECRAKAIDLSPRMQIPLSNKGNMSKNLRTAIVNSFTTTSFNYNYMCQTSSNVSQDKPLMEDKWMVGEPATADCTYECKETSL